MIKWKNVYDKVNHKEYCKILNIEEPAELKSTFSNYLENYKFALLGLIVFLLVIFLAFYKSGAQAFLISVALIFLLLILMVLNNTYRISLKNNKINIIGLFNKKETINCNNLCNVYLKRNKYKYWFFVPIYYYNIVFLYKEGEEIMQYSLSTMMLLKKDIIKFFNHFKFEELSVQKIIDQREKENHETKKIFWITTSIILFITIIVVCIVVAIVK